MTDVVSTLRDTNMRKRRERILHAARTLIATDGFEALNVRALAAAAGVTVPTLYNLIGRKEAIVVASLPAASGNSTVAIRDYRSSR